MKKLLVLILCLSSTLLFAQTLHYTIDNTGTEAMQVKVTGVFMVDGEEIYNGVGMHDAGGGNLEIGVFDQDGICRGTKLPTWNTKKNKWIYQLKIRGYDGCTYPTFKVYDHATETELNLVLDIEETITWTANGSYGSVNDLYNINFTESTPSVTYTRTINGYQEDTNNGGYVLVASPIDGINPADAGMVSSVEEEYDLFRFNQSVAKIWENYKDTEGDHNHFDLEVGRGYLYATKYDTQISVTGIPYSGDGKVQLVYTASSPFSGYNLIGNPWGGEAAINMSYYKLDPTGSYFDATLEDENVGLMEGVLVRATEEGQEVTFTEVLAGGKRNSAISSVKVFLANSEKVIDKAIVRFDGGSTLSKYQLREGSKVYFPQYDAEYAIANAESNEMPLNFKAETTGQYTISIKLDDANFNYLHLFDKLTGEDVNLLLDNEYTFIGSPRDAEDRFIVRFSETAANDTFVYQNGDELIVNGEGTLQVFDVMGRYVATYNVNGNERINASQFENAVYIFRLVGSDIKTQKIVVR